MTATPVPASEVPVQASEAGFKRKRDEFEPNNDAEGRGIHTPGVTILRLLCSDAAVRRAAESYLLNK